jgi:thimet oligopeptidase
MNSWLMKNIKGMVVLALMTAFSSVNAVDNMPIPPILQNPLSLPKANKINSLCQKHIREARHLQSALRTMSDDWLTKWNSLSQLIDPFYSEIGLLANVSPDKNTRVSAENCELKLSELLTTVFQDRALYKNLQQVKPSDHIDEKMKADLLYSFENSGASLPEKSRKRYQKIVAKLDKLNQSFDRHIRDNATKVKMSADDMAGLPEEYIQAQKKNSKGIFELGFEYPQYIPFMTNAKSAEARKRYYLAFQNRGTEKNPDLLEEIIKLRTEMAALFGFPSYAHFSLRQRMAKTPEAVMDFLAQVREKVNAGEHRDLEKLQAFRAKTEGVSLNEAKINRWDLSYWENAYKKANFNIDDEAMRDYMLAEPTVKWALDMTARLYGVSLHARVVPVWHDEVRYYDVIDNETQQVISGIFLDLYPRAGKYGHAAAFPLRGSSSLSGQLPVSALITNFNRRGFTVDEMITLLHEFGHVMHGVLSKTRYIDQSGTSVERDFVEAPSQMFEEWGRHYETLKTLTESCPACKPFTPELVAQIRAADQFNKGVFYARQWLYAYYDMVLYSPDYARNRPGVLTLWREMEGKTPLGHVEGTQFPGNFSHIAGGYAAGYYGYMWSLVNALDMAGSFNQQWLDAKRGRAFRDLVLSQGSQKTGEALTHDFLGRKPSSEAFFKEITGQ